MSIESNPTVLLRELRDGDRRAGDELLPLVYDELRGLAAAYLHRERGDHTLQATALVHEAYLKLVDQDRAEYNDLSHFRAIAALAMQRLLIDHARSKNREKRGGGQQRIALEDAFGLSRQRQLDARDLHDALAKMAAIDERQARVATLRLLGGLGGAETADLLDVSTKTVERDWKMAQAWLRRELSREEPT